MDAPPTQATSILIVDPSREDRERILKAFEGLGYELHSANCAEAARRVLDERPIALVLCELALPDSSGFAFCRALREDPERTSLAVVLVSHWTTERDRILAFEAGADDFAAKPFFERELASRIRAVLRRCAQRAEAPDEEIGLFGRGERFEIRSDANEVWVDGRIVPMTPREFALVLALVRQRGRVLRREELIQQVWGPLEPPSPRSVDAHIKSIRRKLGDAGDAIETIRGLGYRFSETRIPASPGSPGPPDDVA